MALSVEKAVADFPEGVRHYIIFSLLLAINGVLLMIMDIYDGRESMKDRPMKGFYPSVAGASFSLLAGL